MIEIKSKVLNVKESVTSREDLEALKPVSKDGDVRDLRTEFWLFQDGEWHHQSEWLIRRVEFLPAEPAYTLDVQKVTRAAEAYSRCTHDGAEKMDVIQAFVAGVVWLYNYNEEEGKA